MKEYENSKKTSNDIYIILHLINIYKEGTGKDINLQNMNDEDGVISFIVHTRPLISELGLNINVTNEKIINFVKGYIMLNEKHPKFKDITMEEIGLEMIGMQCD